MKGQSPRWRRAVGVAGQLTLDRCVPERQPRLLKQASCYQLTATRSPPATLTTDLRGSSAGLAAAMRTLSHQTNEQWPSRTASLFTLLVLLLCCSASGTTRDAAALCARFSQMESYEPTDICHDETLEPLVGVPFRLRAGRQIAAFEYSTLREIFCFKIGECDANQPVFIAARRGERLPTAASGTVNLTLCTTTVFANAAATLCCDPNAAGLMEATRCQGYSAASDHFYVYRILKWPTTMSCGSLCTVVGSGAGASFMPVRPVIDNRQAAQEVYSHLPDDVQSNVVYTELIPNTAEKVDPRKMWFEYRLAIEERLRRDLVCNGRTECRLATQLLPPPTIEVNNNVTDRVILHYYVWNADANETVDAWRVRAHALLMPDVALYYSRIGDVQVNCELDYEVNYVAASRESVAETNSSTAFAASLAVVGFITAVVGTLLYCYRIRKGHSKLPKDVALNSCESNGGFDNLAMNELHGRIRPLTDALDNS